MDPDEISRLVNEMKISHNDPSDVVNLEETDIRLGEERLAQCLVAKVLSTKAINREAFRHQMPRVLQAERRIDIEAAGDNSFVFVFYSLRDRHRALTQGPWNFARNLLIFKEPLGRQNPRIMTFEETNFWVQLHNIPLAFMHEDLLLKLGRQIGHVVELDRGDNGAVMGRFARIRIRINITQPLRKCIRVNAMKDEEDSIILVVYERIPDFCYACGRLGHSCRECDDPMVDKENLAYGVWMRASTHLVGNRTTRERGTRSDSSGNGMSNHDDPEQQPQQSLIKVAPGRQSVVTTVGPQRESNSTLNHTDLSKGLSDEADRIPLVASLNLVEENNPTNSQTITKVLVPDVAASRSEGLNLDQGKRPASQQWKRRAREIHREGARRAGVSESYSYSGVKRNAQVISETSEQEHTSPIKKKEKRGGEIPDATDIAAAMNIIVWNTRGLGNPRAFRELGRLVAEKKPTLLFLSETKMREASCRWWKYKLGFSGCFMVDCRGRSGGLALLWKEQALVSIKSYSAGHIDCVVQETDLVWRFTGFYGHPETSLRHFSWDLLTRLRDVTELRGIPWLVGGDFNEICFDSEKLGGNKRAPTQMQAFREALDLCELQDLHCSGDIFTWVNRREPNRIIFERLDRFVADLQWRLLFPAARVSSLEFFHSDHRPICMRLKGDQINSYTSRGLNLPMFRFEKGWLLENDCREVIEQGWGGRGPHCSIVERMESCKNALICWDNNKLRKTPRRLIAQRKKLNDLKTSSQWIDNTAQIKDLETEIEELATKDEIYWRQRSRETWLKDGDRNSRYFHSKASLRRSRNTISGLVSSHGDWCTETRGISEIVMEYFESLFSSANPSTSDIHGAIDSVVPKVDAHMNQILCAPFTETEVRRALFDMHPDKAPGPDGFSTLFFQKFWEVVGPDVSKEVLRVLNEGVSVEAWNNTLVTLIPKVKDPVLMKDFRPISLCNVCYKIVSRALTNRFRPILSDLIDKSQSAFIPGRLITDNIIVGFEILHWMRTRKTGRHSYAALKLDMSKAYDRVEWEFLWQMMERLGFAGNWISRVMNCVTSVSYSFRVNQDVVGPLRPSRGIRQGDPLSPYLFVLCAHGLSTMLSVYEARGLFRGAKIASSCPSVSHLFFADDSLVFFRATMQEGARVKECLTQYEKASGQLINYDKSALSFSPNSNPALMDTIKTILTIPVVHQHDLYLGLPTVSMRSKRLQFKYLIERVVKRIQGWSHKWFSTGGKEVLIKSILQAIPAFAMSCFRLPSMVCDDIEKECANFWWGIDKGKRKMHWKTWDFLCRPKCRGGLGFRKLTEFNRALLAKQLWRLIRFPDSLVARVLKGRYFKHGSVLDAGLGGNPSYIWRSIFWSKEILERGLIWRVGDGKSIKIFNEQWIPTMQSKIGEPMGAWDKEATVNELIIQGVWDADLISTRFNPYVAGEILKIPIRPSSDGDTLFWRFNDKGKYTVRDGCRLQRGLFSPPEHQSEYQIESWWAFIWSLSIPPKVRLFWWSISHDGIPANQNLLRHHVPVSESCCLCNYPMDSTGHALFFCAAIKHLWKNSPFYRIIKGAMQTSTLELCMWLKKQLSKEEFENLAVHTWGVWKEKQTFIHGARSNPMADNVLWSSAMICDFRRARTKEKITNQTELGESEKKWKPPRSYNLKLNVDASVNKEQNQYSVGGVVRDSQGRLLLAFGKQINQPLSVVHGELLAIREGIKLLYDNDFRNVQVASDSLLAVQAVTTNLENLSYIGSCAAEIRDRTQSPIISDFIHVRRSANRVAHFLARFVFSSSPSSFVWINGEFPAWLVQLVIDDSL